MYRGGTGAVAGRWAAAGGVHGSSGNGGAGDAGSGKDNNSAEAGVATNRLLAMSHRIISGLLWARPSSSPHARRAGKQSGARAAGLRYENAVAKLLSGTVHGQWFEFEDKNGRGHCQPDLVFQQSGAVWVLEVKYTWVPEAHSQLELLYLPVLAVAMGKPVYGIVICKVLVPEIRRVGSIEVVASLADAMASARGGKRPVLHHLPSSGTTMFQGYRQGHQQSLANSSAVV